MWYPVRTRVSIRQESQFEFDLPNAWQLWSGHWWIYMVTDDLTPTVRTSPPHGPDAHASDMEIAC
jgi:hypothetical protein